MKDDRKVKSGAQLSGSMSIQGNTREVESEEELSLR